MMEAGQFVQTIEHRQGYKIAYNNKWITSFRNCKTIIKKWLWSILNRFNKREINEKHLTNRNSRIHRFKLCAIYPDYNLINLDLLTYAGNLKECESNPRYKR